MEIQGVWFAIWGFLSYGGYFIRFWWKFADEERSRGENQKKSQISGTQQVWTTRRNPLFLWGGSKVNYNIGKCDFYLRHLKPRIGQLSLSVRAQKSRYHKLFWDVQFAGMCWRWTSFNTVKKLLVPWHNTTRVWTSLPEDITGLPWVDL